MKEKSRCIGERCNWNSQGPAESILNSAVMIVGEYKVREIEALATNIVLYTIV